MSPPAEAGPHHPGAAAPKPLLLPAIIAFTVGALAVLQLPTLPDWRWAFGLFALLPLPTTLRLPLLAAALGALLTLWRVDSVLAQQWPAARTGELVEITGVIASLPQVSRANEDADSDPDARTWRFRFDPDDPVLPPHIHVSWYRGTETLRGGECWRLQLRMRRPHGSLNPGGFDYEGWLFRQGIGATATVKTGERCGQAPGHVLLRARQALADQFAQWLPEHPGLPLVAALTIGDTSGLADADWQNFRVTGTTHLIAISGFNVAIAAGIAFFLVRWLWSASVRLCLWLPAQRAGLIGSAMAAVVYALLAGFDPPVERAALMLLALLAAGTLGGRTTPGRALALAWAVIVAADPLTLLTPGLWLSFGAVAAIFYATSGRLAPASAWREALRVQWMLSLMLAPLTLFWFQGTSLLGPLVNLVAVPAAAVLTPALLLAIGLAWALPMLGVPALKLVADLLASCDEGLAWLAAQAPLSWIAASPAPAALVLGLLGALLLFAPAGLPLRAFGALCFAALALPVERAPRDGFRLAVLDVGQGLAVVVRTARHTLLFDTGPASPEGFDAGASVVVPYLLHEGVREVDRMIVSHGDLDHRGGAPAVRAALKVDDEWGALATHACVEGESWDWDGVHFEILNGPASANGGGKRAENNGGCVLRVESARLRALLPADVEAVTEARLAATYGEDLHSELLVAPHHGSKTSSSAAFLDAVQPALVIHCAGWHHRFGHPAPPVVHRYLERGATQLDTADSGAITIDDELGRPVVREWRALDGRLWSAPRDHAWLTAGAAYDEAAEAEAKAAKRRRRKVEP